MVSVPWAASSSWLFRSRLWWTRSPRTTRTGCGGTRWPTKRGRGPRRGRRWSCWWGTTCWTFLQFQVSSFDSIIFRKETALEFLQKFLTLFSGPVYTWLIFGTRMVHFIEIMASRLIVSPKLKLYKHEAQLFNSTFIQTIQDQLSIL